MWAVKQFFNYLQIRCEQWNHLIAVLQVMGIGRMHRYVDKIYFMYDKLQSSPLEISVLRKLVTYTKDKVVQNQVSCKVSTKSGFEW